MILLIPITLLYGVFGVVGLYKIWSKKVTIKPVELPQGVSVVVALKDEEHNVKRLIESLSLQKTTFPIEFILVDDHSDDNTKDLIEGLILGDKKFKLISNSGEGKKAAVISGVKVAVNEIILQTDADCFLPEFWVTSMVNRKLAGGADLVLGPVYPFRNKSVLNGLIRLEWLAMQFITAFTARLNKPGMANGANIAFNKSDYLAFYESELGQNFASGDDMFFLRFLQKMGRNIGFNLDQKAIVKTEMPNNIKALAQQRIRWATKAGKTTNALTYIFSLVVVLANFAWIGALYSVFENLQNLPVLIIAVCWKLITDFVICWNMARFFKDPKVLAFVPIMFFVYPVYLVLGVLFSFRRSYSWKGRVSR